MNNERFLWYRVFLISISRESNYGILDHTYSIKQRAGLPNCTAVSSDYYFRDRSSGAELYPKSSGFCEETPCSPLKINTSF
jgi:hypothetical protein